jgi:hypothetical protein
MMNRGIAAAFVPQTAPEPTGLAVYTHRRHQVGESRRRPSRLADLVACLSPAAAGAVAAAPALPRR